jgi:nitroreductase
VNVSTALTHRISANNFDPSAEITADEVATLVALASQAPSSFNIQHTRFVAVTDRDLKAKLQGVSYNQPKVGAAAAAFVVLGDTRAHADYIERMKAAAALGQVPQQVADYVTEMAGTTYSNPAMARDEAIRSAGLSAMALMLAAEERGWVSCPMVGFDPAGVSALCGIPERYVPLMLVVVGKGLPGNGPRKPRLPVAELLRVNRGDFPA